MKIKIKKILSIILITVLLLGNTGFSYAQEAPNPPAPPPPPEITVADSPTAPLPPEPPKAPTFEEATANNNTEVPVSDENVNSESNPDKILNPDQVSASNNQGEEGSLQASQDTSVPPSQELQGTVSNGNVGNTDISTGDGSNTASVSNFANNNVSLGCCSSASVGVVNNGNGANSSNDGTVAVDADNNTTQNNSASVITNLDQATLTGENSASENTGGNSTINTGDANTTGTVITGINSNFDGVMLSEFNVVDDHIGDIVLDFAASCIIGCGGPGAAVSNTNNGSDSTNTGFITTDTDNTTTQNNNGNLENNLDLFSNSGDNVTNDNTGGNNVINTGDANVAANVLSFVNNNIAGNIVLGVVNIFGDLIGDIILPQSEVDKLFGNGAEYTAANTGNGTESTNNASILATDESNTFQVNDANIQNNLVMGGTTGGNSTSANTGGNSSITTGNTTLDAQILNIANSNIVGGNWWLVIVNEAGKWVGKLLGSPDGSHMAGSAGTEFRVEENGEITAVNSGNGADSTNNATVNSNTSNTVVQNNDANIVNNVNLFANTGGNEASRNTGGNSHITTGDARVIANIINFVNNNITGGGKIMVTVVNVFGSWLGDFVAPGQTKRSVTATADQTVKESNNATSSNSNSESNNSSFSSNSDGGTVPSHSSSGNLFVNSEGEQAVQGVYANWSRSDNNEGLVASVSKAKANFAKINPKPETTVINLAWLLFLLPIGAAYILRRAWIRRSERI